MSKKVNPYSWRLGFESNRPNVAWCADSLNYADYLQKVVFMESEIDRLIPNNLSKDFRFVDKENVNINLVLSNMDSIKGNTTLDRLRRRVLDRLSTRLNINVKIASRKIPSASLISLEIATAIKKRTNFIEIVNFYLRLVSQTKDRFGLRIEIKGRFRASVKTQKLIFREGRIRSQTISNHVDYDMRHAIGKFGMSSVKVWIN